MKILDTIGTGWKIKETLKEHKMSQSELARKMGLTYLAVHKWTIGRTVPTIDNLIYLSEIFDKPIDNLIVTKTI